MLCLLTVSVTLYGMQIECKYTSATNNDYQLSINVVHSFFLCQVKDFAKLRP